MEVLVTVHTTRTYRVVVDTLQWKGNGTDGQTGYRVLNRDTGVCEGEGSVITTAKAYADKLQQWADQYEDGTSQQPLGDDVN